MATAQKRGFHFPWGGDSRREEPEVSDGPSISERLAGTPEDLGRGPFDLPEGPSTTTSEADTAESPTAEAALEAAPATPRLVVRAPNAEPLVIAAPAPAPAAAAPEATEAELAEPEPEPELVEPEPEPEPEPVVAASAASEPEAEAAAAPAPEAESEPAPAAPSAWPDTDRPSSRPSTSTKVASSTPMAEARRANPLVAGLVRAMREAARTAHDEAVATLRVDVGARTEAIKEHGTARAAELKKAADADVLSIREWSKAEMARVREETESKIAARKIQLVAETERESRDTETLLARLTAAVEAFEAETETFFKTLLAEEDPGRLAGLAEQLPPPPSLDEFPASGQVVAESGRSRAGRSPSVTARAATPTPADPDPAMAEPAMATAETSEATETTVDDTSGTDGLDADAAAAAEAEALFGLDEKTQLIVSGLTSVAAIAGFKGALLNAAGVSAVSVNAGSDGDVLMTVTHAADADMRRALRDIEDFQPAVIADDGATLVVVAREPAA